LHFHYVDPGLRNNLGHHANSCRLITRELRKLGIGCSVFAHNGIEDGLRAELGAEKLFRQLTYWSTDADPIAGWLTSFVRSSTETWQDLARMPPPGPDDIVYLNSAQAPQLMALLQWMRTLPANRTPYVMTEFGTGPGLDFEVIPEGIRVLTRDPRQDARAVLYRYAANILPQVNLSRLHMFTFEPMSSKLYSFILKATVDTLPLPHFSKTPGGSRAGRRPVTVSVLGHQRPDKGYDLVPDIARMLLEQRADIRLLIHNGAPQEMAAVQQKLRDLRPGHPQLMLDERMAGPPLWEDLLRRSDIILCPYPVWRFAAAYSAVAAEAVASGIPLVVPAATTLAALVDQYGGAGTSFAQHDPATIVAAVIRAVDRFDELADIAARAAVKWHDTMGAENMVKAMLRLAKWPGQTVRI